VTSLDVALRGVRDGGRKALVPYFVAGLSDDWPDHVRAAVHAGADAVEIGIPFSDPMMDGVVIQEAADIALRRGTTLLSILDELSALDVGVPLVAMTYYNLFHHLGLERSAGALRAACISGTIVPDLPIEELGPWQSACNDQDVACVLMVAPSTPLDRVERVNALSQGFVYASARMAVTGAASDGGHAADVVQRVRLSGDKPVYVGIGITTPQQAETAAGFADGVIVGTALVQRLLNGEGAAGVESFVGDLRRAIDAA